MSWDDALDEIETRWKAILREDGPLAILGYAYSAHQGLFNRGLLLGFFHALGATRLKAGTVCDTCADVAWDIGGRAAWAAPIRRRSSTPISSISWGADLLTTNVHIWPLVEEARRARREGDRDRAAPQPHRRARRLARARQRRHRRRARARHHARARARRPRRPRVPRARTRSASIGSSARSCRASRRTRVAAITGVTRRRRRAACAALRPGARAVHPARRGHVALHRRAGRRSARCRCCRASSAPTRSAAAARCS